MRGDLRESYKWMKGVNEDGVNKAAATKQEQQNGSEMDSDWQHWVLCWRGGAGLAVMW